MEGGPFGFGGEMQGGQRNLETFRNLLCIVVPLFLHNAKALSLEEISVVKLEDKPSVE